MTKTAAGALLLATQLLLVLSITGKYGYERKTRPRIWVRATQVDPNQPLRGRYLALQLLVNACALPRGRGQFQPGFRSRNGTAGPGTWSWDVRLRAENGALVPQLQDAMGSPRDTYRVSLRADEPCGRARVSADEEYFLAERAKGPFPLKPGQEMWVEVTMPPSGPPRPIQMAVSGPSGFKPLALR